jgi:predicted RNase H-like HicB family nuclease
MNSGKAQNMKLDAVLVEDINIGGYTAFFKQFPQIIAEGVDEDDAISNLLRALHDVFAFKGREKENFGPTIGIIRERPVNLCATPC